MLTGDEMKTRMGAVAHAIALASMTDGPSDDLPASTLRVWTVDVQRARYETQLVTVEASSASEACTQALQHVNNQGADGMAPIEDAAAGAPFAAAVCEGDGDPWSVDGFANVPIEFKEHGKGGVGREPGEVKHHAIYLALNAWAEARGLRRFGATLDEFRASMSEFVRDVRALCVDAGHPFGDVLHDSGLDGECTPFAVYEGGGLGVAHRDLEGMFYALLDDGGRAVFEQAERFEGNMAAIEAGGQ